MSKCSVYMFYQQSFVIIRTAQQSILLKTYFNTLIRKGNLILILIRLLGRTLRKRHLSLDAIRNPQKLSLVTRLCVSQHEDSFNSIRQTVCKQYDYTSRRSTWTNEIDLMQRFLKRVLDVHKSSRNCLVYLASDIPLFPESNHFLHNYPKICVFWQMQI